MKKRRCFECGKIKNLVNHHVVPRSEGGTATLLLCPGCHDKAHKARGLIERWQRASVKRNSTKPATVLRMVSLDKAGWPLAAIADELNRLRIRPKLAALWTPNSVYMILARRRGVGGKRPMTRHERMAASRMGITVPRYRTICGGIERAPSYIGCTELVVWVWAKYKQRISVSTCWRLRQG